MPRGGRIFTRWARSRMRSLVAVRMVWCSGMTLLTARSQPCPRGHKCHFCSRTRCPPSHCLRIRAEADVRRWCRLFPLLIHWHDAQVGWSWVDVCSASTTAGAGSARIICDEHGEHRHPAVCAVRPVPLTDDPPVVRLLVAECRYPCASLVASVVQPILCGAAGSGFDSPLVAVGAGGGRAPDRAGASGLLYRTLVSP